MKYALRLLFLRVCGLLLRLSARCEPAAPGEAPRMLLIRPDHLGDVLLSRPAIDALAAALPRARIGIAVGPWGRPALGPAPDREVLICPFPGFSRQSIGSLQPYLLLLRYGLAWRRTRSFDVAVILRPDHWWGALLADIAGIPIRIGYRTPETAPFLTTALERASGEHAVRESMRLTDAAAHAMGADLAVDAGASFPASATEGDTQRVAALLREAGLEDTPLIVLHPGAGSPLKSWPDGRFAEAGRALAEQLGARLVVSGSASERERAGRLCALLPAGTLNLAGVLRWGELEALLRRAALVVGVDSGPLHLAAAAGTPSVALFGPADPAQFAPWGRAIRHRIVTADLPCRPCRRLDYCRIEPETSGPPPCMRGIQTQSVIDAALAAVHEGGHAPVARH